MNSAKVPLQKVFLFELRGISDALKPDRFFNQRLTWTRTCTSSTFAKRFGDKVARHASVLIGDFPHVVQRLPMLASFFDVHVFPFVKATV